MTDKQSFDFNVAVVLWTVTASGSGNVAWSATAADWTLSRGSGRARLVGGDHPATLDPDCARDLRGACRGGHEHSGPHSDSDSDPDSDSDSAFVTPFRAPCYGFARVRTCHARQDSLCRDGNHAQSSLPHHAHVCAHAIARPLCPAMVLSGGADWRGASSRPRCAHQAPALVSAHDHARPVSR